VTAVRLGPFAGQNKRIAPHLLEANTAQAATNARLETGALRGFNAPGHVADLAVTNATSLYRFAGRYWFAWKGHVHAVQGPVAGDTEHRTYFTGDGVPRMTYAGLATQSGDGRYPSAAYDLGLPAPAGAPDVALTGKPDDKTAVAESRDYVYTFVSGKGEEGPPSPASALVGWRDGQAVAVTAMQTVPTGNFNVTAKRIYRTDRNGTFRYAGEVGTGTRFTDTTPDAGLGEALPSTDWVQPPADMAGLIALPNGVLAAFSKNELCFSEPYVPYAWPIGYRLSVDYPIVALGAFGQSICVATEAHPYLVTGTDPRGMSMTKVELPYPCVAARSLVDLGYGVAYASSDGLLGFSNGGVKNLTEGLLTQAQWQAMRPETMAGFRWRDYYVGVSETGAFVLDRNGREFTAIDMDCAGGATDPNTGHLNLIIDDAVKRFNHGDALTPSWTSKQWKLPHPVNFGCAKVTGAGSVHVTVHADGAVKHDADVAANTLFMLPGGFLADDWHVELSGDVDTFEMAESAAELQRVA
jgi:hypothetical protein